MMAKDIKTGDLPKSYHTFGINRDLHRRQQKLVLESTHRLSSNQVHCTVMILSQMAMDLHVLCATFISFGVLGALLVRMHGLVFFKMVAAELEAAEL